MVVASAINEDGDQVYPRKWNHDFIDLPEVTDQHTPTFSAEVGARNRVLCEGTISNALFAPRWDRNEDGGGVWAGDREAYQPGRHYDQDPTKRVVWLGSNSED